MRSEREKICVINDVEQVHSLANVPTVECSKCGVKAHEPVNVCDPIQLPEAGTYGD